MHSQSDNIKLTSATDANKVADKFFDSSIWLYQVNLETSMGGTEFIFDSVEKMHYRYHKVNFRCANSFIDSPDWIKKLKNQQSNCEEIIYNSERYKQFLNKHKWKGIKVIYQK